MNKIETEYKKLDSIVDWDSTCSHHYYIVNRFTSHNDWPLHICKEYFENGWLYQDRGYLPLWLCII